MLKSWRCVSFPLKTISSSAPVLFIALCLSLFFLFFICRYIHEQFSHYCVRIPENIHKRCTALSFAAVPDISHPLCRSCRKMLVKSKGAAAEKSRLRGFKVRNDNQARSIKNGEDTLIHRRQLLIYSVLIFWLDLSFMRSVSNGSLETRSHTCWNTETHAHISTL